MEFRVCQKTGLGLVASTSEVFRVAKTSYGPFSAPERFISDHGRDNWSRFDTLGRTIYAADSRLTAYLELLAPYRTVVSDTQRALEEASEAMGIAFEEYWERVLAEWEEQGNMHAMWLPRTFREGRHVYSIKFPKGWWVDVNSMHTLSKIHDLFPDGLKTSAGKTIRNFTTSHLASDRREVTTNIASRLREQTFLDDGSQPLGVYFPSKHGQGDQSSSGCWAYWQRDVDAGAREPATVVSSVPINAEDPMLEIAQQLCKIKLR